MMLSYVMNLTHIMCSKMSGKSIGGSADAERLVEIRTVSVASLCDIIKTPTNSFSDNLNSRRIGLLCMLVNTLGVLDCYVWRSIEILALL